jgi:hypothetical protein
MGSRLSHGITAADFQRFLAGDLRPRMIERRKHLRLVHTRQPVIVRRRADRDPDDAA